MQDIKIISGIVSCHIFEMNDKKYYLFGDRHFTRSGNCKESGYLCDHFDKTFSETHTYGSSCTTIGALLHNWLTYNNDHNIKTNFYVEAIYTKDVREDDEAYMNIIKNRKLNKNNNESFGDKNIKNNNAPFRDKSWLELIPIIMQPCFIREKGGCPYYPNVHSHYIDIRLLDTKEGNIGVNPFNLSLLPKVTNVLQYIQMLILNYKIILQDFLSPYGFEHFVNTTSVPDTIREEFIADIAQFTVIREINGKRIQMYKAAWELYRLQLQNPQMAEQLSTFMYHRADASIYLIINQFTRDIKGNVIDRKYYIDEYRKLFLDMESIIMDSYTLARVFLQEGEEVIIYAGNYHIAAYKDFFNYIHYPLLLSVNGDNCLRIPKLPLYLDANKFREYVMNKQGTTVKQLII
jgi:hypothetical protein